MLPTFAILNNLNGSSMILLGLIGLLLFGKDLPTIARNVAGHYFRFKKMITDATSDIKREMDVAANQLEEEKRRIERETLASMKKEDAALDTNKIPDSGDALVEDPNAPQTNGSKPFDPHANGNGSHEPAPKPAADPLALDVPAPSSLSHRATEQVKSPAAKVAALDSLKSVPPPSRIPPPV